MVKQKQKADNDPKGIPPLKLTNTPQESSGARQRLRSPNKQHQADFVSNNSFVVLALGDGETKEEEPEIPKLPIIALGTYLIDGNE